jgi:hypothetical protein
MKNPENKKGLNANEPSLSISATLCEPSLLKKLVERLAFRHPEKEITGNLKPGWDFFDSSSIEAYVSGDLHLASRTDLVHLPFANSFLFTCIRLNKEQFMLTWCSSLS